MAEVVTEEVEVGYADDVVSGEVGAGVVGRLPGGPAERVLQYAEVYGVDNVVIIAVACYQQTQVGAGRRAGQGDGAPISQVLRTLHAVVVRAVREGRGGYR